MTWPFSNEGLERVSKCTPQVVANVVWAVTMVKRDAPGLFDFVGHCVSRCVSRPESVASSVKIIASSAEGIHVLASSTETVAPGLFDFGGRCVRRSESVAFSVEEIVLASSAETVAAG